MYKFVFLPYDYKVIIIIISFDYASCPTTLSQTPQGS